MYRTTSRNLGITLAGVLAFTVTSAHADIFGTTGNEFTIDFVGIGNAGNADDAGAGGGLYFASPPFGGVSYDYRIGTYEISQDVITKATASGLANVTAGAFAGGKPAGNLSWYEAAAFVNWMNTSTGHVAAYQLNAGATAFTLWSSAEAWQAGGENLYRNKDAIYFLPSEDEWYKAAFHQNDGVTANYWDYATGSNTIPTAVASGTAAGTVVYGGVTASPSDVNSAGGLSGYGTMGQNGNVYEWLESATDGTNNSPSENRGRGGGYWGIDEQGLRSSSRYSSGPDEASTGAIFGFRVASVPEPSSALLLLGSGWMFLARRRRASSL